MRNPNPIVHRGPCVVCGEEVALFKRDEDEYLENVHRGLVHFGECMEALARDMRERSATE